MICSQLGLVYSGYSSKSFKTYLNNIDGLVWLDNVQCNGSESSLASCSHDGWSVHTCTATSLYGGVNCRYKGGWSHSNVCPL